MSRTKSYRDEKRGDLSFFFFSFLFSFSFEGGGGRGGWHHHKIYISGVGGMTQELYTLGGSEPNFGVETNCHMLFSVSSDLSIKVTCNFARGVSLLLGFLTLGFCYSRAFEETIRNRCIYRDRNERLIKVKFDLQHLFSLPSCRLCSEAFLRFRLLLGMRARSLSTL